LSDQYEIFWIKFPEEVFQWLDWLQEALEYKDRDKRRYNWTIEGLAALHQLDHQISRVVDLWVHTTLEGYIIEFAAKNHQYFSKSMKKYLKKEPEEDCCGKSPCGSIFY
jgi:hypothetical protein